jgi:PRD domain protein (TIGR03582 family)
MNLSSKAREIIVNSGEEAKLEALIQLVEGQLNQLAIQPNELQWTVLINHLSEMLNRSKTNEKLPDLDLSMFEGFSQEILAAAKFVTTQIGNLSDEEAYLLALHFETAKQN